MDMPHQHEARVLGQNLVLNIRKKEPRQAWLVQRDQILDELIFFHAYGLFVQIEIHFLNPQVVEISI
jgi:hypothetical protein